MNHGERSSWSAFGYGQIEVAAGWESKLAELLRTSGSSSWRTPTHYFDGESTFMLRGSEMPRDRDVDSRTFSIDRLAEHLNSKSSAQFSYRLNFQPENGFDATERRLPIAVPDGRQKYGPTRLMLGKNCSKPLIGPGACISPLEWIRVERQGEAEQLVVHLKLHSLIVAKQTADIDYWPVEPVRSFAGLAHLINPQPSWELGPEALQQALTYSNCRNNSEFTKTFSNQIPRYEDPSIPLEDRRWTPSH